MKTTLACLLSTSLLVSPLAAQNAALSAAAPGVSASNSPAPTNSPSVASPYSAQDFVALTNGLTSDDLGTLVTIAAQPQAGALAETQALTNGLTAGQLAAFYALGVEPLVAKQYPAPTNSIVVSGPVLNVNFGSYAYARVGLAAIGQTENDYWNGCYFAYAEPTNTTLPDLLWSDGSESGIDLTILNAPGDWANGSYDTMFRTYTYSYSGGITITMENVAAGTYDFYLYGHGPTTDNSIFQLGANQASTTTSETLWTSPTWVEGYQYIVFPGVAVTEGQALSIYVLTNGLQYALIAGLQMVPTSVAPSNPPPQELLINIDCLNGYTSGETNHYAAVEEVGDYWNCLGLEVPGPITALRYANGTGSYYVGLSAPAFGGDWADGSTDPMYNDYIYPGHGYSGTMTVTNLPPGAYCVYAYSFDGNFALSVGANSYGTNTTAYNISGGVIATNPPPWIPGLHYASWTNVIVTAGQPMVLTVMPGLHDGWAVIAGLQIFRPLLTSYTNTVLAWGPGDEGDILDLPADLPTVTAVAGGVEHAVAVEGLSTAGVEGAVLAWGNNSYGQTSVPVGLSNVAAIAAGPYHTLALTASGTVSAWGSWWPSADEYPSVTVPQTLTNPETALIVAVAAGADHDAALRDNGSLTVWGYTNNSWNSVPLGLSNVQAVAAGFEHTVALSNGMVRAWGSGALNNTNVPLGLSNVVQIAAGAYHTLALTTNGTVWAWGAGSTNGGLWNYGQSIVPAAATNVVQISAGGYHSMALTAEGAVVLWGDVSNVPSSLTLTNVADITAGQGGDDFAICAGALPPMIVTEPASVYTPAGGNVTFSVNAYGVNVQYQWQFKGVNIAGATNSTLTLTDVGSAQEGAYQVVATDPGGSTTSSTADLVLVTAPIIQSASPPVPSTNYDGGILTLSVTAGPSGDPGYPLTYLWQFNGTAAAAGTSSQYGPPPVSDQWRRLFGGRHQPPRLNHLRHLDGPHAAPWHGGRLG
jgi:hypothetical protein